MRAEIAFLLAMLLASHLQACSASSPPPNDDSRHALPHRDTSRDGYRSAWYARFDAETRSRERAAAASRPVTLDLTLGSASGSFRRTGQVPSSKSPRHAHGHSHPSSSHNGGHVDRSPSPPSHDPSLSLSLHQPSGVATASHEHNAVESPQEHPSHSFRLFGQNIRPKDSK